MCSLLLEKENRISIYKWKYHWIWLVSLIGLEYSAALVPAAYLQSLQPIESGPFQHLLVY